MSGYAGESEHTCECGHVRDEHDGECTIDECPCLVFDRIPDGTQATALRLSQEQEVKK